MTVAALDPAEAELLAETLRKTMSVATGRQLDTALAELGWPELLTDAPDLAIPMVFRLLGETGAHAAVLDDVVRHVANHTDPGPVPLPFAGGRRVAWDRDATVGTGVDEELPLTTLAGESELPTAAIAAGRRALGWWLVGTGNAMLTLARRHVLERKQFGRPLASFQAIRHRLAETLVALDGAEAALAHAAKRDNNTVPAERAA